MNNTILYALAVPLLSASGGLAALNVFGKWSAPAALNRALVALALTVSGYLLGTLLFQTDGMHFGFVLGLFLLQVFACAFVHFYTLARLFATHRNRILLCLEVRRSLEVADRP